MDKNLTAIEQLKKGIALYVNQIINKHPIDITYTGVITNISTQGYTVKIGNQEYPNVKTIGGSCSIYETVKVLIPQGNYSNMFILKGGNDQHITTTDYTQLTNKPMIGGQTIIGNIEDVNVKTLTVSDNAQFNGSVNQDSDNWNIDTAGNAKFANLQVTNGIDADTVQGHTVESDIPPNLDLEDVVYIDYEEQSYAYENPILYRSNIVDNLTSTNSTNVLSANQGKILNDKIEAFKEMTYSDIKAIWDSIIQ